MNQPLRILALGPQHVFPPVDGGKEGIFGAIAAVARQAQLTYAFPTLVPQGDPTLEGYAKAGVRAIPVPFEPVETIGLVVRATASLRPYKFEKYGGAAAARAFDRALPNEQFDAILCHNAHTVQLAERLSRMRGWKLPMILREHNIEYEIVTSYRMSLSPLAKVAALPFEWLTIREEQSTWRRADCVAFLSDHDLEHARATGVPGRFVLAREGTPQPARRHPGHPGRDAPLLVLLNPRAAQSVVNLRDFVRDYWLPLRDASAPALQGIELHVTGVTSEQLATLIAQPAARLASAGVKGLGFIPDLATVFATGLALVSPTFVGGGVRKKLLEALANELPAIATPLDLDTCNFYEAGRNILRMTDSASFADAVALLRDNPARWQALSASGRDTIDEYASWDGYADVIVESFRSLLAGRHDR